MKDKIDFQYRITIESLYRWIKLMLLVSIYIWLGIAVLMTPIIIIGKLTGHL